MMLALLGLTTVSVLAFWHWFFSQQEPGLSGDTWYMRQFAFTDKPVSPPYCWRPLLPVLARVVGFRAVTYAALLATPFVIYGYAGGGRPGLACALIYLGGSHMFRFNVRCPEYVEGLGQLLMIGALWAMQAQSPLVWPLLVLCALCRETITAALTPLALLTNPAWIVPLAAGSAVAYFGRKEATENIHPLVEPGGVRATVRRWIRSKGEGVASFAHVIQPLRAAPIAVPFVWNEVGDYARLGLLGFIPIWLLAIPASGQSRIMCYGFGLLIPFVAVVPEPWLWLVVGAGWFWPVDVRVFDETGGESKFGFVR